MEETDLRIQVKDDSIYTYRYIVRQSGLIKMLISRQQSLTGELWPPIHTIKLDLNDDISFMLLKETITIMCDLSNNNIVVTPTPNVDILKCMDFLMVNYDIMLKFFQQTTPSNTQLEDIKEQVDILLTNGNEEQKIWLSTFYRLDSILNHINVKYSTPELHFVDYLPCGHSVKVNNFITGFEIHRALISKYNHDNYRYHDLPSTYHGPVENYGDKIDEGQYKTVIRDIITYDMSSSYGEYRWCTFVLLYEDKPPVLYTEYIKKSKHICKVHKFRVPCFTERLRIAIISNKLNK